MQTAEMQIAELLVPGKPELSRTSGAAPGSILKMFLKDNAGSPAAGRPHWGAEVKLGRVHTAVTVSQCPRSSRSLV